MAVYLYKMYMAKRHEKNEKPQSFREQQQPANGFQGPTGLSINSSQNTEKPTSSDKPPPCSEDEKKAKRRDRFRLIAGLLLPSIVQFLDITIISGALPFIASDFSQYYLFSLLF